MIIGVRKGVLEKEFNFYILFEVNLGKVIFNLEVTIVFFLIRGVDIENFRD